MEKHTIKLTQDDINNGVKQDWGACPIALTIKRTFPGEEVTVGTFLGGRVGKRSFLYGDNVTAFIDEFDRDEEVEGVFKPFDFNIWVNND
jgi:hypothetical protein